MAWMGKLLEVNSSTIKGGALSKVVVMHLNADPCFGQDSGKLNSANVAIKKKGAQKCLVMSSALFKQQS